MLRIGETWAVLVAPGMPLLTVSTDFPKTEKRIWLGTLGVEDSILFSERISFDQAIQMVEESAQANLDQALTLLARKLKGPWKAKPPDWIVR